MEKYNKVVASNPKLAFIHASLDDALPEATRWARDEKFPWLTIFPDRHEAAGLEGLMEIGAPETVLIDKTGKVLTRDEDEAFAIAAALK